MKRVMILAAVATAVAAVACYQSDVTGLGQVAAHPTRVFVTDDPFPYDSVARVDVYIDSISIRATLDTTTANGWITVATPHQRVNLLDLQNGNALLLDSANVPPGQYGAVRVVLNTDSSDIMSNNGAIMNIDWQSSAGHPTLNAFIEKPIGIADAGGAVVIDFDVGRSFLWYGTRNTFVFSPVLRAVEKDATGAVTGTLVGSNGHPLAQATLGVYSSTPEFGSFTSGGALLATARTADDGSFSIAYLLPGSYALKFEPEPLEPYQATADSITITAGQTLGGVHLVSQLCSSVCNTTPPDSSLVDSTRSDTTQSDTSQTSPPDTTQTDTTQNDTTGSGTIARIVVTPDSAQVVVGDSVSFTAAAYNAQGQMVSHAPFAWAVSDSTRAHVSSDGVVIGLAPGGTSVFAIVGSTLGGAALLVKNP
ncbi:MAG TPA: DUF4382 domain-containing protein [Gemmatimonadaceae bacterium]|nr:DUF4382 domain-containing protein [Gemmatimonadaceae bacterium]